MEHNASYSALQNPGRGIEAVALIIGQVVVETFKGAAAKIGLVGGLKAKATNTLAAFMTSGYNFVCTQAFQEDTVDISKPTKKALGLKSTKILISYYRPLPRPYTSFLPHPDTTSLPFLFLR